ncbi:acyl-CoA dehydrogenase family protein [Bartonella apis]|uniref:acyl-CoA dehydrogenase family protein n=1 Tax=Bartonella apis TaxID=1686310 RepID=UPI0018DD8903|nr:acyl-CoA dehydrogenase family protein [Bartonella apis]MBI0178448.1 acyl-CoA/acyl-ACP dehydrogenase [Bartonella apis]
MLSPCLKGFNKLYPWAEAHAEEWDTTFQSSKIILERLAKEKLTGVGVPEKFGGDGKTIAHAILTISDIAYSSFTAAFVLWAHRAYIECVLQSPNEALKSRQLPLLTSGKMAGSAGLSNLMKHLCGLEKMENFASLDNGIYQLTGKMPWITNIDCQGFFAACAAELENGRAVVFSLENNDKGVTVQSLDLLALRSSGTKAITMDKVALTADRILHDNIAEWLKTLRPAFIALQCGLFSGLAARFIDEAKKHFNVRRTSLKGDIDETEKELSSLRDALIKGVNNHHFVDAPEDLFRLRISLTDWLWKAVLLELETRGGGAYLMETAEGFPRRLREASFVPIITPSVTQLKKALA